MRRSFQLKRIPRAAPRLVAAVALAAGCSRSGLDADALCAAPATIRTGDPRITLAGADARYVYWFREGQDPALRAAPRCGGEPLTVTTGATAAPFASDGTRAYYVDGSGSIAAVTPGASPPTILVDQVAPIAMAAAGGWLYYMTSGGFWRLSTSDAAASAQSLGPPGFAQLGTPAGLVTDGSTLWFTEQGASAAAGSLLSLEASAGAPATLVQAGSGGNTPLPLLALDAARVYYATLGGEVRAAPRTAGATSATLARYELPDALAVSRGFAWWHNGAGVAEVGLRRAPLDGTAPAAAVPAGTQLGHPIADDSGVFVDDGSNIVHLADGT